VASSSRTAVAGLLVGALLGMACGPNLEQIRRSDAEYDLAYGLFGERNVSGAIEHLEESLRLDPQNAEAHLLLGKILTLQRSYDDAEAHLLAALEAHEAVQGSRVSLPSDAYNALGVLYVHGQRLDEAVEVLERSANDLLNQTPHMAWANLAWARLEMEAYPEAARAASRAVELSAGFCIGWYRLAQAQAAIGRDEEAEEALARALDVEDEVCQANQEAWRLRGTVLTRLGYGDEAVEAFERCVELQSSSSIGQACREALARGDLTPRGSAAEPETSPDGDSTGPR
jgi:type IV pilus assembly protein PilF